MVTKLVTELKVSPSDWLTNPSSINQPWQIWYRYNGTLVKVQGMNREKVYSERVKSTLTILQQEKERLNIYGYNPLERTLPKSTFNQAKKSENSRVPFIDALKVAFKHLDVERNTLIIVKSCLKYVSESALNIGLINFPINQIRKKHLKELMNDCSAKRKLSARSWNAYRAYLMMLFEQLDQLEMVDHNPARELKKKKETINLRQTLTAKERERVKVHLQLNYPDFYRFVQIFFHSGSRRTELLSLQVKDVNLDKGEYRTLVKKGHRKRYVIRAIKTVVSHFWNEQLKGAPGEYYVFSEGLIPGQNKIRPEQLTRRWKVHVKEKLNITADLYSLKHLNTDETASILDIEAAAAHNSHTTSQITKKHYAFGEEERMRTKLKSVSNEF